MNTNKNKILLIIPAYNEEESILNTCNTIIKYCKNNNVHYDFLVVNDGSKDNTENICIKNKLPHLKLKNNLGIGNAVQAGYKYAMRNNYDIAIQFDGDGQHDISFVEKISKPLINNEADIVIGSRFINKNSSDFQSSGARRIGIKLISFFIKAFTGRKIYDTTSGFRAVNKKLIKKFAKSYYPEYPEPVSLASLAKQKFRILEVPVSMNERTAGKSSINSWKSAYFMMNVILLIIVEVIGGYKNEY